ncbi:nucleolin 2-like isoform X2 [Euphorbia lathyris]|uniref:nucleolin 2-like isoform X2 n=1 Tax=Euphorbia lathyris TaxID=212925 RepID=UPI0033140C1C
MGKSSKKSASKVIDVPAVSPLKSTKKGKREAEESIEKLVSAKKQKRGQDIKPAVPVKKPEVKTQKKKVDSSSSDDSSSEEEQKLKVVTKKAAKPPVEVSSSDESSSDEEPPSKATVVVKQTPAKKGKVDTTSDSSDDDSDEEPPAKAAIPSKKQPVGLKNGSAIASGKKVKAESSSSDSSDDESEEDEKPSAKTAAPVKKQVGARNGSVVESAAKAKAKSSSDSSSDDSSSDEEAALPKAAITKTVPQVAGSKKAESSESSDESDSDEEKLPNKNTQQNKMAIDKVESDDESSDESEDEKPQSKKTFVVQTKVAPKKESSSDEESSDESSDDEGKSAKKNAKVTASKKSSSDESSSEESSDEEEESDDEKSFKTPKKNATDVEMVDASHTAKKMDDLKSAKKAHQTPVSPQVHSTGSKTLFVGNLSFQVERADVENFFKDAGEVVDVRFSVDQDQRFKGFGHVEFATAEGAQKALKLNGQTLNGRDVRLDLARERGERTPYTPNSGKDNSFGAQGQKVYVRGFDTNLVEDEIRGSLGEHFKACGDISRISIPTDRETGSIKGMAYLEFQDSGGFNKALELNGSEFGDQYLTVQEAKPPRSDSGGGWSNRGGSGGRRGGRDFGRGGGRDFGRGGGRDFGRGGNRGRGRFNKPSITTAASGKKTTFGDD